MSKGYKLIPFVITSYFWIRIPQCMEWSVKLAHSLVYGWQLASTGRKCKTLNKQFGSTLLIGYEIGKKTTRSMRTTGDIAAPTANPYREQTAWGMIWSQTLSIRTTKQGSKYWNLITLMPLTLTYPWIGCHLTTSTSNRPHHNAFCGKLHNAGEDYSKKLDH